MSESRPARSKADALEAFERLPTLAMFAAYDKDTLFVPGHGQPCGQEGIASIREVFDDIAKQAENMFRSGVPVQEAVDRYVVPDTFKNLLIYSWGFMIGPTITKLYAEWQAKWLAA